LSCLNLVQHRLEITDVLARCFDVLRTFIASFALVACHDSDRVKSFDDRGGQPPGQFVRVGEGVPGRIYISIIGMGAPPVWVSLRPARLVK